MIQAFCQAPESLQSRLAAGSYRPVGEDLAYLCLPSAHRRQHRLPGSRTRAGQRLSDTAATMHPHRVPAFLTCSPAPFIVPAVMLDRPFARTIQLPKLEMDDYTFFSLLIFFFFPALYTAGSANSFCP